MALISNVLPTLGGVQRWVNVLANALRRNGIEVDVLSAVGANHKFLVLPGWVMARLLAFLKNQAVFYLAYRLAQLSMARRVARLLRSGQLRVIHAADVCSFNAAYRLARKHHILAGLTIHGALAVDGAGNMGLKPDSWLALFLRREEELAFRRAAFVTAIADDHFRYIAAYLPDTAKVFRMDNMVDTSTFYPDPAAARPSQGFVILSPSRLVRVKGTIYALQAVSKLVKTLPVTLVVAGDGPEREALQRFVQENGLAGAVQFLGEVEPDRMGAHYRAADAVVIPSISTGGGEGTPMAALEAMAAGVPVIASRVGGLPGIIVDRETGLLVPERDPAAIAAAITTLHSEPDLRAAIIRRALAVVRERYSDDLAARKLLAIYQQFLPVATP